MPVQIWKRRTGRERAALSQGAREAVGSVSVCHWHCQCGYLSTASSPSPSSTLITTHTSITSYPLSPLSSSSSCPCYPQFTIPSPSLPLLPPPLSLFPPLLFKTQISQCSERAYSEMYVDGITGNFRTEDTYSQGYTTSRINQHPNNK